MGMDAVCLSGVIQEIKPVVEKSKIDKIQQPSKNEIILALRGGKKLLINAGATQPRMHLTTVPRDNPAQPPMFCMLLRKYLTNGFIVSLEQIPLERVIKMTIEALDEMGEMSCFYLYHECMGRHSNLVLCNKDGIVIDCMKRVDFEMSQNHQVLPGLLYHLPVKTDKVNPFTVSYEEFSNLLEQSAPEVRLDTWLLDTFDAISPLIAREIVYGAYFVTDRIRCEDTELLWKSFCSVVDSVNCNCFTPVTIAISGKLKDYSFLPIRQYGSLGTVETFPSFSEMLDSFYESSEQAERVRQKGQDLLKSATNARDRLRKKLLLQQSDYEKTKDRDQYKLQGQLITANLYRIKKGDREVIAQNYYDENLSEIKISLDPRLSPNENANRYFKLYTKAKTAEKILGKLIEDGKNELEYLESVLQEIKTAESEQDFNDIRLELSSGGYLKKKVSLNKSMIKSYRPRYYLSSAGLPIAVGRSNTQNDKLTFKDAEKRDYWFHTQKIHGSHVILFSNGTQPDEQSIFEAAVLAAYFSQGRDSTKIPVDYTMVRNVKKPSGSKPGMVIYNDFKTLIVSPDEKIISSLKSK